MKDVSLGRKGQGADYKVTGAYFSYVRNAEQTATQRFMPFLNIVLSYLRTIGDSITRLNKVQLSISVFCHQNHTL